jgi:predicted NACHT family NTPase
LSPGEERRSKKIERLPALEGLRKYAFDPQVCHVLLIGRPGSGKSTALARLLLEESQGKIPVLVELRYYRSSIAALIQSFFQKHDLTLTVMEVEQLLHDRRLLLLVDGVNELPSEEARQELAAFRRSHLTTPMIFTTRDLGLGDNLGIEKSLEMQPLTEAQMREFVRSRLADQAEVLLGQLKERLRELGQTPLLLWMLCEGQPLSSFTKSRSQMLINHYSLEEQRTVLLYYQTLPFYRSHCKKADWLID